MERNMVPEEFSLFSMTVFDADSDMDILLLPLTAITGFTFHHGF